MLLPKITLKKGVNYFLGLNKKEMYCFHAGDPLFVPVRVAAYLWGDPKFQIEGLEKIGAQLQNVKVNAFQLRFDLCP